MEGVVKTAKTVLPAAAIGALILYFGYHALAGEQGLAAWTELQNEEARLTRQINALKAEKTVLNASLERLRDKSMDLDYVEEIARTKLSFVRPDELLVAVR